MIKKEYLLKLTKEHQTPFFVYDGGEIKSQFSKLQKAFSGYPNLQINYAMKALSTISILKLLKKIGSGVDTVSINEVKIALIAGFKPEDISFTPNGVHFNEIIEAIDLGVKITLDNIIQIKEFAKLKNNKGIGVRINPKIKDGGNTKIKVAGKNSKFGLPLNKIRKLHKLVKKYNLQIDGFHIHVGSDVLNIKSYLSSAKVLFDTAKQFENLKFLNFGGGFKVKYCDDDHITDINLIGSNITKVFTAFTKEYKNDLQLIIEPGKFLVSNSGLFLTEVTTIKKKNIFVNSGFNHFIRPMYYDANHKISNLSSLIKTSKKYNIVGYICEQDNFGKNRNLTKPSIGDIICIKNAGAYSFTMASNYNSRLRPAEFLFENDKATLIRKEESFEDLLTNQVY